MQTHDLGAPANRSLRPHPAVEFNQTSQTAEDELRPAKLSDRFVDIIRAAALVEGKRFLDERDVSSKKWFEYRFLPPVQATELFYQIYQDLYRQLWRKHFDFEKAKLKRVAPVAGLWSSGREFNSVWRARQIADGLELPYDFFIREAMETALRRGARRPPRPNQLYDKRNVAATLKRWSEHCRAVSTISILPQYRIEAFRGLSAQVDHQAWVVANLKARAATPYAIADACFVRRVITIERAETEFSPHQIDQVRYAGIGMAAAPVEPLPERAFWPSCFGVPHAHDESSSACANCPAIAGCRRATHSVREKILQWYGSDDPRLDERRAKGRDRVRRH